MTPLTRYKPTGKVVIASLVLAHLVYALMLGYTIPRLVELSAGLPIFDMSPSGYSYDQALALLGALGESGREFYLIQLGLDLFYPALFGFSFFALFKWLLHENAIQVDAWHKIATLPILAALFDYAENVSVYRMLVAYPDLTESMVDTASKLTIVKSVLVLSYWLCLVALVCVVVARKITKRDVKADV